MLVTLKKRHQYANPPPPPSPPPLRLLFYGVLNLNIELNTDRRVIIISIKITFRAGSRSLSFRRSENIILFHYTAVFSVVTQHSWRVVSLCSRLTTQ